MDPVAFVCLGEELLRTRRSSTTLRTLALPTTVIVGEHDSGLRDAADALAATIPKRRSWSSPTPRTRHKTKTVRPGWPRSSIISPGLMTYDDAQRHHPAGPHRRDAVRDDVKTATLRMALSAITKAQVAGKEQVALPDSDVVGVLRTEIRKRHEAADMYDGGGRAVPRHPRARPRRTCCVRTCPRRSTPRPSTPIVAEEVAAVTATGVGGGKAMGQVVKAVRTRVGDGADGACVAATVKAALGLGAALAPAPPRGTAFVAPVKRTQYHHGTGGVDRGDRAAWEVLDCGGGQPANRGESRWCTAVRKCRRRWSGTSRCGTRSTRARELERPCTVLHRRRRVHRSRVGAGRGHRRDEGHGLRRRDGGSRGVGVPDRVLRDRRRQRCREVVAGDARQRNDGTATPSRDTRRSSTRATGSSATRKTC